MDFPTNYYPEKITDKYNFFWNSAFSQWFFADIVIDDVLYSTNEKYMMDVRVF